MTTKFRVARSLLCCFVSVVLIDVFFQPSLYGQGRTEWIALRDDPIPGHSGTFTSFEYPRINNNGNVAFRTIVNNSGFFSTIFLFTYDSGIFQKVIQKTDPLPDGNGQVNFFPGPIFVNDLDQVAVFANLMNTSGGTADDTGIFLASAAGFDMLAREGSAGPMGTFGYLGQELSLGQNGHVTFRANEATSSGTILEILSGTPGQLNTIVRNGDLAPNGNGTFNQLFDPSWTDSAGGAVYQATLSGSSGGGLDNEGIFIGDGVSPLQEVVRDGSTVPDGNGDFHEFEPGRKNELNHVVFEAKLRNTSGGTSDDEGIFLFDGSSIIQMAREGQASSTSDGTFDYFAVTGINQSSQVCFWANLTDLPIVDRGALFRYDNGMSELIAMGGDVASGGPEKFDSFDSPCINESGVMAFRATLIPVNGSAVSQGIYLADEHEIVNVVRLREPYENTLVTFLQFKSGEPTGNGLNDFGQVAYYLSLGDGRQAVRLFTPDLRWRSGASGDWDTENNWTLGLAPAWVHDVLIEASVEVAGPVSDTDIRSIMIGDGSGMTQLSLDPNGSITTSHGIQVALASELMGGGTLGGNVACDGQLSPGNETGDLIINGDLSLSATAITSINIESGLPSEFGRLIVSGDANIGGQLSVQLIAGGSLQVGITMPIVDVDGVTTGQFDGLTEGALVENFGGLDLFISYVGGDGNDVILFTEPEPVVALASKFLDGVSTSGQLSDTYESDDQYLAFDPSPTSNPNKQIVQVILLTEIENVNPSEVSFRLEAAYAGGPEGDLTQTVELWNVQDDSWEQLDVRDGTLFDSTVTVVVAGDVSRVVHPLTGEIFARLTWKTESFSDATFTWDLAIDEAVWLVND